MTGVCYSGTPTIYATSKYSELAVAGGTAKPNYTFILGHPANTVSDPTIQNPTTIPPGFTQVISNCNRYCWGLHKDTATVIQNVLCHLIQPLFLLYKPFIVLMILLVVVKQLPRWCLDWQWD